MNKILTIAVILTLALTAMMLITPLSHAAGPPPIQRPMGLIEETIDGGSPATVDYSIAYDTASGEIIQNMMDTLVVFNGEHTDQFLPAIATSWTTSDWTLAPHDSGLPIAGLSFENAANQTGTNAKYYYQVPFQKSRRSPVPAAVQLQPNTGRRCLQLPAHHGHGHYRRSAMDDPRTSVGQRIG